MTDRLYYNDTYLKEFDATVCECIEKDGLWLVRLDRSAFYPTSGGQPFDTGTLGGSNVTDVYVDDNGEVWHVVDSELTAGASVHGNIDWERRFDHMQQHAGEHMLANAAYRIIGGGTIGLHLGAEVSTIDMTLPEGRTRITEEEIRMLEDDVNSRIQRNVIIKQWFPESSELASLPLRKAPTVTENVRIVQIGDLEFCACGGTHPATAGEIGLLKIVDARPSRGKLRLAFVCGKRAFELFRTGYDILHITADRLSTSVEKLPEIVTAMDEDIKRLTREISQLRRDMLLANAASYLADASVNANGVRIIGKIVDGDVNAARELATNLTENTRTVAVIGVRTASNISYVICRSADTDLICGTTLSTAAKKCGGKGGGRPDFAQGGGPEDMLALIVAECTENAK